MLRGIDVSTHQGTIDWDEVAGTGLSFAIIKATQGWSEKTAGLRNFTDSKFKRNITEAHRIGTHHSTVCARIVEQHALIFHCSRLEIECSKIDPRAAAHLLIDAVLGHSTCVQDTVMCIGD